MLLSDDPGTKGHQGHNHFYDGRCIPDQENSSSVCVGGAGQPTLASWILGTPPTRALSLGSLASGQQPPAGGQKWVQLREEQGFPLVVQQGGAEAERASTTVTFASQLSCPTWHVG